MVGTATSAAKAVHQEGKPMLYVECCTKQPEPSPRILADQAKKWIREHYTGHVVHVKKTFPVLDVFHSSAGIHFITVADITSNAELDSDIDIHVSKADIKVDIFELHGDEEQIEPSEATLNRIAQDDNDDVPKPQAKITNLPNKNLHGLWDSFYFETRIQFQILRMIIRMMSFAAHQRGQNMPSSSKIVLLHGPPGCGKTSLCRALAQQLSIRLNDTFPVCKLVEFDTHAMFSQYFGETGKVVDKAFTMIESMLEEDENTLICVFLDDIEALADKRQYSGTSVEPNDSLRAVNALLKALDRLRCRHNVLFLCTSKYVQSLDSAFLDRVAINQSIPDPGQRARYEILRSCYFELAQSGNIAPIREPSEAPTPEQQMPLDEDEDELGSRSPRSPPHRNMDPKSQESFRIIDNRDLPPLYITRLHYSYIEESVPLTLWRVAVKSTKLSGRTLRRLPGMSLVMYSKQDPCPINKALEALSQAVDIELSREKNEHRIEESKTINFF